MSDADRIELRDFIDMTLGADHPVLTDDQKAVIRRRAAEMDGDPSIGVPWDEVYAELMSDLA